MSRELAAEATTHASSSVQVVETIEPTPPPAVRTLLDQVLEAAPGEARPSGAVEQFLAEERLDRGLRIWCGRVPETREELQTALRSLSRDIVRIDRLLEDQVNVILHHPRFQQLESAWRGLWLLTGKAEAARETIDVDGERGEVKIRVLHVSKRELRKDFAKAIEFDQSSLFKKVYEEEFGTAGGQPYGLLLGDYEFTNHVEDIELLGNLTDVAAAAFAPLVTSASPQLLGVDDFSTLEQPLNLSDTFQQLEYVKWRALRDREDTRFLGLTLPRILMRQPYVGDGSHPHGFRFREDVEGTNRNKYLWGTSAWAFGTVAIRAYATSGWFADIRGAQRGHEGGGLVTGLEVHSFSTDPWGVAIKTSTEIAVSDAQEKEMCNLGFIPLCDCPDTEYSVFYANQSVHNPQTYDDPLATTNARISSMLQYVLCSSRFAHYLKVLARNKIGSFAEPHELQDYLNKWLAEYVTPDEKAPPATKARYPLREAQTVVGEIPGRPGQYRMNMYLLPHYQLDQLNATVRLIARVSDSGKESSSD